MNKFKAVSIILSKLGRDFLVKSINHKYYKREGVPGHYRYYYTEAEYKQAKGIKAENKPIKQTETKEFKKWFGDSKVVDSNGKPMVVYHGTNADFNEFDISNFGKTDSGWAGKGFYFTSDSEASSSYADKNKGSVIPVYLSIKNPYDFKGKNAYEVIKEKGGAEKFTKWAIENGYDGTKMWSQYVAFFPTQIKSATGNNGNFDKNSSDITKSKL